MPTMGNRPLPAGDGVSSETWAGAGLFSTGWDFLLGNRPPPVRDGVCSEAGTASGSLSTG
jgi:hypothetical protein